MAVEGGVVAMQATAACSVVFSLIVMISIVYKNLYHKLFLKLIFLISLCDCLGCVLLLFGATPSESAMCYLQGTVSNYFSLASFFWSAVIAYEVQLIVFHQQTIKDLRIAGLLCWFLPLIATLVPLSSNVMANDDMLTGWCFIDETGDELRDSLWNLFGFYFWLIAVMIYLWYVVIIVCHKFFVQQRGVVPGATRVVLRILSYPLIVVVCWTANIFIELGSKFELKSHFEHHSLPLVFFNFVLPLAQGALTAIAFFVTKELTANSGQRDDSTIALDSLKRSKSTNQAISVNLETGPAEEEGGGEEEDAVFGRDTDDPPPPPRRTTAFGAFLSKIRKTKMNEPRRTNESVGKFSSSSRQSEGSDNIELRSSNFENPIHRHDESSASSLRTSLQSDVFDLSRDSGVMAASWVEIDQSFYE